MVLMSLIIKKTFKLTLTAYLNIKLKKTTLKIDDFMKKILQLIKEYKCHFCQHPFFTHNNALNPSINSKLYFLPNMSFFIMIFGGLNKFTLLFLIPKNRLKKLLIFMKVNMQIIGNSLLMNYVN